MCGAARGVWLPGPDPRAQGYKGPPPETEPNLLPPMAWELTFKQVALIMCKRIEQNVCRLWPPHLTMTMNLTISEVPAPVLRFWALEHEAARV